MPDIMNIQLTADQIPIVSSSMPYLRLGVPNPLSVSYVRGLVAPVHPMAKLTTHSGTDAWLASDASTLVAFQIPETAETQVFAKLENLKPIDSGRERAMSMAKQIVSETTMFPHDDTTVIPLAPKLLMGHTRSRDQQSVPQSNPFLIHVRFQRRIGDFNVYGPGTRAMVGLGHDEAVHALAHRWRVATMAGQIQPHSSKQIEAAIRSQLALFAKLYPVRVDRVQLAYYDSGMGFIQPVYRFSASAVPPQGLTKSPIGTPRVYGFVSIGNPPEPLPTISLRQGPLPTKVNERPPVDPMPTPDDPVIGRYVVQADSEDWVNSANDFLTGLYTGALFSRIPITDSQYYWAEPRFYVADKDSFVNAVHVALTEAHGNWGKMSTWMTGGSNPANPGQDNNVYVDGVGSSGGYGGSGALGFWIIHSCAVIPTATDYSPHTPAESDSFSTWWDVFNGLHAVVGYRTAMWINDRVTRPFGVKIGFGAPVVPSWLNTISSDDSYDDEDTYYDENRNIDQPMGRASAIAVTGHSDDTLYDVGPHHPSIGAATQLTQWWFEN